jgi:hypothetical protein
MVRTTIASYENELALPAGICGTDDSTDDKGAQLKQVCDAKQTASASHNDDRIDGSEVRKVFWNRSRAAVMMLEIQTVLGQSFPGAQLFEFLPAQGMKRMHYSEPLQPLVTTICSA